jgi:GR25 family glycosyltransferase involved in LPS biosynthesis
LSDYEIACTLSHIKALSYLNDCPGNYFLIVEDDVCVDNLYFLKDSLQNIISEAPTFDIMLLFKTSLTKFNSKYISWNDEYNKGLKHHIAGTVAYIICKEAIPKILEKIKYNFSTCQFIITKPFEIDVADIFLYKYTTTLTYKYNFFATLNEDSEIHKDHLHFHKKASVNSFQEIINDLWR